MFEVIRASRPFTEDEKLNDDESREHKRKGAPKDFEQRLDPKKISLKCL